RKVGRLSVRVCVLGSGSRGNSTLFETAKTRLLVDAGFSRKETYARLAAVGARADGFDAVVISHEHTDHIAGLRALALDLKIPIYITPGTRDAIRWDARVNRGENFAAGHSFTIRATEITPFAVTTRS